ncbi:MAG: molybdopterin-dependent oxidoreductase [Burkholderiales bacterium]|nr:molybdopterin-dependent oxidoreductase [Burkholderiales bacterium]
MPTVRTTCRLCLVRCGITVETDAAGRISRFVGDRAHPLSKGYLCIKGKASLDIATSPKRVLHPLRRAGERGAGRWERVSWDAALDNIAARIDRIVAADGARAVAVQALPPKEYFAYDVFCSLIGSPTFFKHDSHQCFTPQLMADTLTFGNLLTYPSYTSVDAADLLILWGINPSETNGSKYQRVRDAQRRGARTIVVDPRPTRSAREADLWLRVRPGTDAALALGIINEMIARGWYDRAFVDAWTVGFDALRERAARYTPERVAEIAWVPAEAVRAAARMIGEARAAALYTFIGVTMGGNSIASIRLMGFIPALTGRIDQPGTNGFLPPTGARMPGYYAANLGLEDHRDLADQLSAERFPLLAGPHAITTPYPHPRQVIDAMLSGKPYPRGALWTNCNPVVGLEDTATTIEALKRLDLLVVSDLFESPTARLADYVLPVTMHLESDAISEYSGINMIWARKRAVAPRGEAREEADVVLDVLGRMGYADRLPFRTNRELLDFRLAPLGIDFEEFAARGSYVRPTEPLKYRSGKLRRDGTPGFNTPSGKVEFASGTLARFGYDPLPDFVEPPLGPVRSPEIAARYPLVLMSGTRTVEYYSTLGIEVPRLRRRRPFPSLEIAPETAAAHALADGDWVSVAAPTTERTIARRVEIVPGMDPRVVNAEGLWYLPGREDLIEGVLAVGANVLTPLTDEVDPVCGGSIARAILCRIEKTAPPPEARA